MSVSAKQDHQDITESSIPCSFKNKKIKQHSDRHVMLQVLYTEHKVMLPTGTVSFIKDNILFSVSIFHKILSHFLLLLSLRNQDLSKTIP